MRQYFLVIYSRVYETQKTKLREFFKNTREIFSNVFTCELESDGIMSCEEVRTELLKGDNTRLMVIRLDADFSSAWYLSEESSDYLKSIFNSIHNGAE